MLCENCCLLLTIAFVACGSRIEAKKPTATAAPIDAGTWSGDGCTTLRSREEPLDITNATFDGDLHKGREHCYLDLQRALCVRYPGEDGGLDEIFVRTLRLASSCDNQAEVRLRGTVHGSVEPLGVQHPGDWTVDAKATSLERAKHVVDTELSDASAARKELLESFMLHCWRNASIASPTTSGHLALDVVISPSGEVKDVRRREAVGASEAFEACVEKSVRAPQMFVEADAGASREISLRVTFSVAVSPL